MGAMGNSYGSNGKPLWTFMGGMREEFHYMSSAIIIALRSAPILLLTS